MMNNLFSTFDPSTNFFMMNLSMNWISSLFIILLFPLIYWFLMNNFKKFFFLIFNMIYKEFNIIINKNNYNNFNLIYISLLFFLMFNNFISLFPYIFNMTSQVSINLSMSIPLWFSLMLYGWINKLNHMFIHLVPQGTPNILIPFMILIETVSNLMRPITLMIRLTANMIAGHLLLTLLGNSIPKLNLINTFIMILIQMMLLILESAVSLIQAYVFSILLTLYTSEIN